MSFENDKTESVQSRALPLTSFLPKPILVFLRRLFLTTYAVGLPALANAQEPNITRITVNPTTNNFTQILDYDVQGDRDLPFIAGSTPIATTAFNAALKANSNAVVGKASAMPLMLLEERIGFNAQGSDTTHQHTFANWQYIDRLVAWGGTADWTTNGVGQAWIDAAHRNGVKVYGNTFLAPTVFGGNINQVEYLIQTNVNGDYIVADKLIEVAEAQGFDGWFLNQETGGTSAAQAEEIGKFMEYIQSNSEIEIIWYDAMNETGSVGWQGRLNSLNDRFFQNNGQVVSNGMFLDFRNTVGPSNANATALGRDPYDLYKGANLEASGIAGGQSDMNGALAGGQQTSVGLFRSDNFVWDAFNDNWDIQEMINAEGQLYVGANGDPSNTAAVVPSTSWNGFAHHIAAKTPLTKDRFISNFNYGLGHDYYVEGEKLSTKDWNNIGAQDVLPTWRWMVETADPTPLSAEFDFGDGYNGGNSLRISGSLNDVTDLPLFLTDIPVHNDSKLILTYKTGAAGESSIQAFVTLNGAEGTRLPISIGDTLGTGWNEVEVVLGQFAGETISSMGLRFLDNDDASFDVKIGQLGLIRGERDIPAPATNLRFQDTPIQIGNTSDFEVRLLWDHSADYLSDFQSNNLYYYNVYQVFDDNTREHLGVTGGEGFYINDLLFEQGVDSARLVVEAVSLEFGRSETQLLVDWDDFSITLAGDFNSDDLVNVDDYIILLENMFVSPLGDLEGDLNGDSFIDIDDHIAFKSIYEGLNGNGSFASILVVPEPGAMTLVVSCIFAGAIARHRRPNNHRYRASSELMR